MCINRIAQDITMSAIGFKLSLTNEIDAIKIAL